MTRALRRMWTRLVGSIWHRDSEADLVEELDSHIQLLTEDYRRRGLPPDEAYRRARIQFGGLEVTKDRYRDQRGLPALEGFLFDLRLAWRGLWRDRTFTLVAIAMLTLALALNATVFTVMNAMLFRGLPLARQSDRLVFVDARKPLSQTPTRLLYSDFEAWRSEALAFEGMAFRSGGGTITFRAGDGRPLDMSIQRLSANTFGLLGVAPVLGRDFVAADEAPGAAPVVILSYAFWESRFGKRAEIIGSNVEIDKTTATIVGVMPAGFVLVYEQNLWMPLASAPTLEGGVFGRLRDDATAKAARTELDTINRRLQAADPATDRSAVISILTYSQAHLGPEGPKIYGSLWVGAWFVLLIACANLANLTLVRTIGRWREFSTRMALGAGQWRMIRQILMESLTVATVAGVLGWWITTWSVQMWAAKTASRYLALDYRVDGSVLAYMVAIGVVAAILFSLAPIVRVVQLGVGSALKGDARGMTQGLRGKQLGAALVAGQMALAIVLLSGAAVLIRSLANIVNAESGVRDPEHVLVGSLRLPSDKYPSNPATRLAYFDRVETQLRTISGVEGVSVSSTTPVNFAGSQPFEIEGRPRVADDDERIAFITAGPDYFRVMRASAISGRDFTDGDHLTALPVAIVNESFVARFWPGEHPLGKRVRASNGTQSGPWRTVVGVVPNIMQGDPLRQHFKPLVYVPFRQDPVARGMNSDGCCFSGANILVRTRLPADLVAATVRAEIQAIDPDVSLERVSSVKASFAFDRDRMDVAHAELGKHALVAPIFAVVALLLAAAGLSAVIGHSVSQRTKEIGVRMAIGAAWRDIRRLIVAEGMRPVAVGSMVGLAASLAVNRILQSQLVGVSPYDPVTLVTAPALLILVALVACQIPARRATRVDPVVALRHD